MMKFSCTLASLVLLLAVLTTPNPVVAESVAELRRLRASSRGLYQFGGDNGRDHPQNYPKPAPTVTNEVSCRRCSC
eukprot:scaffold42987_cov122-Amphora_coffeaeformis.AAC.1